ncbi:hypothetical protein [Paenibacillus sp. EZ-K15]|uniref:hypothetical protein n=1 Tax=Paenibacillus sp. EZ-K15 TaxID=2044275 RepID=UPI00137AD761|nr:hypothetical protein [Paenibacillus sp. EZ-K15]
MRFRRDDKGHFNKIWIINNKPPGMNPDGLFARRQRVFSVYCVVLALPSARNQDRQVRAHVRDRQDHQVRRDAMDRVHAHVRGIHGHRDIPGKTEGTDRTGSKVEDSKDKDRTGIRDRDPEYQGLF